jgi:hypothetical protein
VLSNPVGSFAEVRTSEGGVSVYTGYVNRFEMTGDLVGYWEFQGDVHIDGKSGKGRSVAHPAVFEIESSEMGKSGTFECAASFKIEGFSVVNWPGDNFLQEGNLRGCEGTGGFEGMRLRAYSSNAAYLGTWTHDMWGEIR